MDDDKRSFWTTVPGILTGLAALVAAIGAIYAVHTSLTSKPIAYTEWPSVGPEKFADVRSPWTVGSFSNESGRLEVRVVEGKYRWDLLSAKPVTRWIESPHGSVVDFYAAADARLLASTAKDPQISLLFGKVANKDYSFTIARWPKGTFFDLTRFDGTKHEELITWTPAPIELENVNRLAVLVENSTIKLFINSSLVGDHRDPSLCGPLRARRALVPTGLLGRCPRGLQQPCAEH